MIVHEIKNKKIRISMSDFYTPAIFNGWHIALPLSICPSHPVYTKNNFLAISFEFIGVLDSYHIHRYIIIKYRSSSIKDKIHQLLSELWPLIFV